MLGAEASATVKATAVKVLRKAIVAGPPSKNNLKKRSAYSLPYQGVKHLKKTLVYLIEAKKALSPYEAAASMRSGSPLPISTSALWAEISSVASNDEKLVEMTNKCNSLRV
jgi:hypothetical protein